MVPAIFHKEPIMKKKNAFTLIEIMVVIVIMGVLAAVGIPKLFSTIAKAKASEVHAVAGTYIHAQDAYLHGNNAIGSWKDIGFTPPTSKVFEYSGCVQDKISPQEGENITGILASNRTSLNECQIHSVWALVMTPQDAHNVTYQQVVSSAECGILTPNWNVGNIANGDCSAAEETTQAEPEPDPEPTVTPEPDPQKEPANNPSGEGEEEKEEPEPEPNDQCSNGSPCSNANKCSLGEGATNQGKEKKMDCSKDQFKGCCACCP